MQQLTDARCFRALMFDRPQLRCQRARRRLKQPWQINMIGTKAYAVLRVARAGWSRPLTSSATFAAPARQAIHELNVTPRAMPVTSSAAVSEKVARATSQYKS
jgi:hypothetical protein